MQLGQLPARPQERQVERWLASAGNCQVQLVWKWIQQRIQRGMDAFVLDHVVVIQHQDDRRYAPAPGY